MKKQIVIKSPWIITLVMVLFLVSTSIPTYAGEENEILSNGAENYTISLDLDGGSYSGNTDIEYIESQTITLKKPHKTGYKFGGWTDESGAYYSKIAKGTKENLSLKANWIPNVYKIRFAPNGGKGTMGEMHCEYGKNYQLIANHFTKEENGQIYELTSWNTKKNGTGERYSISANIINLTDKNNKTIILYAQWKPKTVKIYDCVTFTDFLDNSNAGKKEINPEKRMAHNIYANPVLRDTNKKYNGFMVDFKTTDQPIGTFWELCGWNMDLSSLKEKYKNVSGGGAYCGLQSRQDGTIAIMSCWEYNCDGNIITPSLVYHPNPIGSESFSGEGEGSRYLTTYEWKANKWYRLYLKTYDDEKTGNTFAEMWIMDIEANRWDKICTYDTKLKNSYMTGPMSQFMENFNYQYSNEYRTCEFANYYLRDYETNEWQYCSDIKMSIDTCWDNKKGTYAIGSTTTNAWGVTCGYGPDAAKLNEVIEKTVSLKPAGERCKLPDEQ